MPGFQGLPSHRAQQNIVPQPSPNFIQQRGQSAFPFGSGIQQQSQASSQHTQQTTLSHAAHQQQQPPSAAATPSLPPHLSQTAAPSLTTAPSVSSASEVGLDHNDFPALGSTPTSLNTPSTTTNATSYASQAGTGTGVVGNGAQSGAGQRDFTADDFPALGGAGPGTQQQPSQAAQNAADGHPPGLNGFRQNNDVSHPQSLLGALSAGGQLQPGVLNLSGQARNQAVFQSDAEKRVSPTCAPYTRVLINASTMSPSWACPHFCRIML
jgi:CCR4-NOT transcription complex subunit 2